MYENRMDHRKGRDYPYMPEPDNNPPYRDYLFLYPSDHK